MLSFRAKRTSTGRVPGYPARRQLNRYPAVWLIVKRRTVAAAVTLGLRRAHYGDRFRIHRALQERSAERLTTREARRWRNYFLGRKLLVAGADGRVA